MLWCLVNCLVQFCNAMFNGCVCILLLYTTIPCLFYSFPHFQYREDIYAHPCFQAFPKQFTDDYLSDHLYGQEARKVFIQHPWFNIEVFLKRTKDGRSIIHRHLPKVAKTFNINEASIFTFRFSSFPDKRICLCTVYDANFERSCETWCWCSCVMG